MLLRLAAAFAAAAFAAGFASAAVFETSRTLRGVRPRAAAALWRSETWRRGRYGLPLPPPIDLGEGERLVVPPGLREKLLDYDGETAAKSNTPDGDEISYAVANPGWWSLYPVTRHRGTVRFDEADDATRMTWTVESFRRADLPKTGHGDAAAATWIFSGDESRRRRGCDVDIQWR